METGLSLVKVAAALPQVPALATPLTLQVAKQKLDERLAELQTAKLDQIPRVTIDIQRLRIAVMILSETPDKPNQDVYREMSLLTRLIKQVDLDDDNEAENAHRQQTAREKLEQAGITPAAAAAVVGVLTRRGSPRDPLDDADPESDAGVAPGSDGA